MCHLCRVLMRIDVKAASINLLERMDFGEPSQAMLPPCCKSSSPAYPFLLPQAAHLSLAAAVATTTVCLSVFLPECIGVDCPCTYTHTHIHTAQSADSFLGCCCFIPRRFVFVALPCECTSSVSGAHYDDDVAIVGKHTHTHIHRLKDAHIFLLSLSLSRSPSLSLLLIPLRVNFLPCSNCKKIINLIL